MLDRGADRGQGLVGQLLTAGEGPVAQAVAPCFALPGRSRRAHTQEAGYVAPPVADAMGREDNRCRGRYGDWDGQMRQERIRSAAPNTLSLPAKMSLHSSTSSP